MKELKEIALILAPIEPIQSNRIIALGQAILLDSRPRAVALEAGAQAGAGSASVTILFTTPNQFAN